MIGVAERGTASCCIALEGGIPVAAKTGTAQLGDPANPGLSHAWIIAFAPADNPQYAVSVVLTNVQSTPDVAATGGRLAGPIAKGMLDFLLTGAGSRPVTPAPATPAPATPAPATSAPAGGT
jgi:peptidoglycan glycosyltransferase